MLNNAVGVSGVAASGSGPVADGVRIDDAGNDGAAGANETLVQGNTILNYGEVGLFLSATNGNNILDATVFGNTMAQPGPAAAGALRGIWVNSGALAADTNTVNVVIGAAITAANKNTLTGSDPSLATDVFLENDSSTLATLNLSKNGSTSTTAHGVIVDDNIVPSGEAEGNSGAITLVSTLPTTPPLLADPTGGVTPPAGVRLRRRTASNQGVVTTSLSQGQLNAMVAAALQRWELTGLTAARSPPCKRKLRSLIDSVQRGPRRRNARPGGHQPQRRRVWMVRRCQSFHRHRVPNAVAPMRLLHRSQ